TVALAIPMLRGAVGVGIFLYSVPARIVDQLSATRLDILEGYPAGNYWANVLWRGCRPSRATTEGRRGNAPGECHVPAEGKRKPRRGCATRDGAPAPAL